MWPFGNENESIQKLKNRLKVLPSDVELEVSKFRGSEIEMNKFCEFYGIACASTHYDNLFLEYDSSVEKWILVFSEPITKCLKTKKNEMIEVLKKSQTEEEYLLLAVINIIEKYLGSGNYHIYRATLSPDGTAFALIHYALCRIAENKGYLSEKEKKDILDYTKDCINQVG